MSNIIASDARVADFRADIWKAQEALPGRPVDIISLCERIGPEVFEASDMPKHLSGFIQREPGDKFKIYYNGNEPKTRQRFTVAHELAHYILHRGELKDEYPESVLLRGGLSNKKETEANKLAAAILMPYDKLDAYVEGHLDSSIEEVAKVFGVSAQTMSIRMGIPLDI